MLLLLGGLAANRWEKISAHLYQIKGSGRKEYGSKNQANLMIKWAILII
jgi:hypothetical protein